MAPKSRKCKELEERKRTRKGKLRVRDFLDDPFFFGWFSKEKGEGSEKENNCPLFVVKGKNK